MMRYFAYGNLMDIEVMRRIAPSAQAVTVACLKDHRIAFATCADPSQAGCTLEPAEGAETWGVEYELSEEDMATLDRAAGVPVGHWRHTPVTLRDGAGRSFASTTYVIPAASGPYAPPATYTAPILKGAKAFDLPNAYVWELERIVDDASGGKG